MPHLPPVAPALPAVTGPTPELPITLGGWWRRDWSLSNELVGPALVTLRADEVVVTGRRSSLARGLLAEPIRSPAGA